MIRCERKEGLWLCDWDMMPPTQRGSFLHQAILYPFISSLSPLSLSSSSSSLLSLTSSSSFLDHHHHQKVTWRDPHIGPAGQLGPGKGLNRWALVITVDRQPIHGHIGHPYTAHSQCIQFVGDLLCIIWKWVWIDGKVITLDKPTIHKYTYTGNFKQQFTYCIVRHYYKASFHPGGIIV